MKEYKKYVIGSVFMCLVAFVLAMPAGKSEAFWPFSKAKTENNINYTGAVANTKGGSKIATSTITVISPNGGEVLEVGKTYTIRWKSKGLRKKEEVDISLTQSPDVGEIGLGFNIAKGIPNKGFYKWKVSTGILGGNLKIIVNNGIFVKDESDGFFSISY